MAKLQVLPEPQLSLQVMGQITKAGEPVILPVHIAQNGTYYAGADKASGYNPVTVDVDMTPAKEEGYLNGYNKGHTDGVADGIEQGKQAEYDAFWDAYQQNGTRTDYERGFKGAWWMDANFNPKYDIAAVGNAAELFRNCGITDLKGILEDNGITLDLSQVTYSNNTIEGSKITRMPILCVANIPNCSSLFTSAKSTVWIDGIILSDSGTQTFGNSIGYNWTLYSNKMEHFPIIGGVIGTNIYFNGNPLMDDETIQSVIDHLKDLTGQTAQTLTFHATVGAKLTDTQKAAISAKNWTLVY